MLDLKSIRDVTSYSFFLAVEICCATGAMYGLGYLCSQILPTHELLGAVTE